MKGFNKNLIAPCGINCGVCKAHLREKNPCHGCRAADQNKPKTRVNCKIRNCEKRKGDYCDCKDFPCDRLKHLDERYCEKYGMSEIENLEFIKKDGIEKFLAQQNEKYVTDKGTFCVHDKKIYEER